MNPVHVRARRMPLGATAGFACGLMVLAACSSPPEEPDPIPIEVAGSETALTFSWGGGPVHFVEVSRCEDGCEVECSGGTASFAVSTVRWRIGESRFELPVPEPEFEAPLSYGVPAGELDPDYIPLEAGRVYSVIAVRYLETDDDETPVVGQAGCQVFRLADDGTLQSE